jgi:peptide-methionine (S)-S-oxide reductase
VISFSDLLDVFFATHDPTTLNRQGADAGTQYRSVIFCHSAAQREAAERKIAELNEAHLFPSPIVTQVVPAETFFPAEAYHQGYYQLNQRQPYCQAVISPKLAKLRSKFAEKLSR